MTTLTLAQLNADLLRIQAHGLTATNVLQIQRTAGGKIYAETDTSELEADLISAKAGEELAEKESAEARARSAKLEAVLKRIADMDTDGEGQSRDEWGEAACFSLCRAAARQVLQP